MHLLVGNLIGPEVTMSALDSLLARVAKACPTVRRGEELKILVSTGDAHLKSHLRINIEIVNNKTGYIYL